MKVLQLLLVVIGVFIVSALLVGGCVYSGYARVHKMDQEIEGHWAEVESQLQRRFDLVPNLVATVKGLTAQEQEVFLGIARSREKYAQATTTSEKAEAASLFERSLQASVRIINERYPDLRSSKAFQDLMYSVEGTENRLAVARKRYNDAVTALNTTIRRFPGTLYASLAGVEKAEYFRIEEAAREVPRIDFSPTTAPTAR
jgi:LemA protein